MKKKDAFVKVHGTLIILIVSAITSVGVDIYIHSYCTLFGEINRILFSMVGVIAGFWVTGYLLFLQIYKDRYPLTFIKDKYLLQMRYKVTYIIYSFVFGCFIIIKNGGALENICFTVTSLYTIFTVIKGIYDTNKTIMVNTYVDEYCTKISNCLEGKIENTVEKNIIEKIRYVLDECIVKEEYFIAQNIATRLGDVFEDFLKNSIGMLVDGRDKKDIEDLFEQVVDIGIYQLSLCQDINSDLLIGEISKQQVRNIYFCIKSDQYEWFKKYIDELCLHTFEMQRDGNDKVAKEEFKIYTALLDSLIKKDKEEWIKYMLDKLSSMTSSLNFVTKNINLKYYASLITYGLLHCENTSIYDYMYAAFERFTNMVVRISKGFSDITIYYVLYFNDMIKNKHTENLTRFFDMCFGKGQDVGNDRTWTEFKFYCINEVEDMASVLSGLDVGSYHIKLLVEVIEMKELYKGHIFFPNFREKIKQGQYLVEVTETVYKDIRFLLNKCIISDNLNMFYAVIKQISDCMDETESRNKDIQTGFLDIIIWLINRTKRLNNKQYMELTFNEFEVIVNELDKRKAISDGLGDRIIREMSNLARQTDAYDNEVVLYVVNIFLSFLKEKEELHFISSSVKRKEKLYQGIFNIATSCIENDFEEGLRSCSNAMGWFTIYSIKQGNTNLTKYLIGLAKEVLQMSIDMNVSTKTETFILTLFTTVGMYCCKEPNYNQYIDNIFDAIKNIDKKLIDTAIKIRTFENDMWNELFDGKTEKLTIKFRDKYEKYSRQKK